VRTPASKTGQHRNRKLAIYYRPEMSPLEAPGYSKSPTKPRRFVDYLRATPLWPRVEIRGDFTPVQRDDLLLAHESGYIDAFCAGKQPLASSNGLAWSPAFRDSVLYTNGSLLAAITAACADPTQVTMSPTSGFHHATPGRGGGFCTFSGQVIAALKLHAMQGLRGAWVDLDAHHGNSIEDSRAFAPALDLAVPCGFNINPRGSHAAYLADLQQQLQVLEAALLAKRIDYVCVAHGADSHEDDALGGQCSTDEWLAASDAVYAMLARVRSVRPVPVTLALFGGYRDDDPEFVLWLHAADLERCLAHLGL
jgi:acetoin utilization deacetylase AcuC-like enzyme